MASDTCRSRSQCCQPCDEWVSNPPIEQKNTCRLMPVVDRSLISFATCDSCAPRLVPGKTVVSVAEPPDMSAFREAASWRTRFAAWIRARPLSNWSTCCNPVFRASAADCGQNCMPLASRLKPGNRLADWTALPLQNSTGPEIETVAGKVDPPFRLCTRSTARPPQPVPPELVGTPLCICWIWSECENRLVGTGTAWARYCARVQGWTSIPTLAATASRPWAQSGWSGNNPGFNPNGVPSGVSTGSSAPLLSGNDNPPRAAR